MTIRRLELMDTHAYRGLMLDAYARHPEAFTSSMEERAALPFAWWQSRVSPEPDAPEIVIGAFRGPLLVGTVGVEFDRRFKARHKAFLFGMYVDPSARRSGIGARLVEAALATARSRPGVGLAQLTVTGGNDAARALYERAGFVVFGDEPYAVAVHGGYVSKLHMWCDLGIGQQAAAHG